MTKCFTKIYLKCDGRANVNPKDGDIIMKNVAVIGAGTMGHSLAMVFAGKYHVHLNDIHPSALDTAKRLIRSNLNTLYRAELIPDIQSIEDKITYETNLENAVEDADLIVETISENAQAKKDLFSKLGELSKRESIIASNTSYLNIFQLLDPRKLKHAVIAHWYNPPHILPIVEIVPGPETPAKTVQTVTGVLKQLGKEPVVLKKFIPGFIGNRLQAAMNLEVYHLLDSNLAEMKDIDKVAKYSFGLRLPVLGILARHDFTGLDLVQAVLKNKSYQPPKVRGKCKAIDALVRQNRLGVKSGKGFYDYGSQSIEALTSERDLKLLKILALV